MYKTILHPTDLSEHHFHMCEKAVQIASSFQANIHFIHVIEPPAVLQLAQGLGFAEFDRPIKDDAQAVMEVLGEALGIPSSNLSVEIGSIKAHVLEKAKQINCDLLIVGRHSPSKLPAFLGSTAHAMIHNTQCDILTIMP